MGKIKVIVDVDVKGEKGIENVNKGLKGTSSSILDLKKVIAGGAIAAVGASLVSFGLDALSAASDVEEMQSKFDTVFGEFAGQTTADLKTFADEANRSTTELQGFAAGLQDTFVPLGFAREEAAKMSVNVTKLAEDLASFNNVPTADVVRDLQSALVGNTETLRKYGVVASQAAIEQEAITSGLIETKSEMTAQIKAQAILQLTIAGTTDAQGDAIRTSDSFANSQKGLEAQILDTKIAIGQELMPAASILIGTMGTLIEEGGALKSVMADVGDSMESTAGKLDFLVNAVADANSGEAELTKSTVALKFASEALNAFLIVPRGFMAYNTAIIDAGLSMLGYEETVKETAFIQENFTGVLDDTTFNATSLTQELKQLTIATFEQKTVVEEMTDRSELFATVTANLNEMLSSEEVEIRKINDAFGGTVTQVQMATESVSTLFDGIAGLPASKSISIDLSVTGFNAIAAFLGGGGQFGEFDFDPNVGDVQTAGELEAQDAFDPGGGATINNNFFNADSPAQTAAQIANQLGGNLN